MNDNEKRDFCTGCGLLPQRPVKPKAPVCGCKKKKCCKKNCCDTEFAFRKVVIPAALGDDVTGKAKPENGAYTNSYVEYEAGGAQYMYDSYGVYTKIEPGSEGTLDFNELENRPKYAGVEMTGDTNIPNVGPQITALQGAVQDEKEARIAADGGLQTQIDALAASSDVTDIVGTYAALQAYDTSKLKNNDIIKVLQDETHDDETTYYRWSTSTETFTLIGEEGPYYTKAAADQKFQDKLTAGDGITIDSDNVISADSETIFYANLNETGTTRHIYKDINFTSAASAQDIIDANNKGQVILRGTSLVNPTAYNDAYLQNAFIMPHNNDYEFVFLDRDIRYEYTVSAVTDTNFYYYTSEIQPKLTAGTNINISGTTISATDTTYSNFTGTDGVDPGTAGLVPAPATTDAGKYLKADGTWDTVSGGIPTNATFWGASYDSVNNKVDETSQITLRKTASAEAEFIKLQSSNQGNYGRIGLDASNGTFIRNSANNKDTRLTVGGGRILLSSNDSSWSGGAAYYGVDVGSAHIHSVSDPVFAQDAATKNYTDNLVISYASLNGAGAPTTSTAAQYVGQLYLDTTNDDMYYCSAITAQGTTPETYTYTWNTIGGGPTVVQTTGTSQTDVMSQVATSQMIYPSGFETNHNRISIASDATPNPSSSSATSAGTIAIGPGKQGQGQGYDATVRIGFNNRAGNSSVAIGHSADAGAGLTTGNVVIGRSSYVNGDNNVTIGAYANTASNTRSVALGRSSVTTRDNEVSVGGGTGNYATRYISNVTDPSLAQDAATKNYVDSFYPVGTVYSSTSSTAPTFAGGTWTEIGTQTIGSSTVHYYERTA